MKFQKLIEKSTEKYAELNWNSEGGVDNYCIWLSVEIDGKEIIFHPNEINEISDGYISHDCDKNTFYRICGADIYFRIRLPKPRLSTFLSNYYELKYAGMVRIPPGNQDIQGFISHFILHRENYYPAANEIKDDGSIVEFNGGYGVVICWNEIIKFPTRSKAEHFAKIYYDK